MKPMVICQNLARKFGLKVKGRRNSLSLLKMKRQCAWLNGTTALFSVVFKCSTDVKPNFRVPITEKTHQ